MPSENIEGVLEHKRQIALLMKRVAQDWFQRAVEHDYSKFSDAEFDAFEQATPLLKNLTYGSEDYRAALRSIKPAIAHHYRVNSHHPEYFEHGVNGMTLVDVLEMVCDWIAATRRVKDGDIYASLPINQERFAIDPQLLRIITNTIDYLLPENEHGERL